MRTDIAQSICAFLQLYILTAPRNGSWATRSYGCEVALIDDSCVAWVSVTRADWSLIKRYSHI
jgi:hypothetical protein